MKNLVFLEMFQLLCKNNCQNSGFMVKIYQNVGFSGYKVEINENFGFSGNVSALM